MPHDSPPPVYSAFDESKMVLAMPNVKAKPFSTRESTKYRVRRKVAVVSVKLFNRLQKAVVLFRRDCINWRIEFVKNRIWNGYPRWKSNSRYKPPKRTNCQPNEAWIARWQAFDGRLEGGRKMEVDLTDRPISGRISSTQVDANDLCTQRLNGVNFVHGRQAWSNLI